MNDTFYAVFDPEGKIITYTLSHKEEEAKTMSSYPDSWANFAHKGYTVRPIKITEVKDES